MTCAGAAIGTGTVCESEDAWLANAFNSLVCLKAGGCGAATIVICCATGGVVAVVATFTLEAETVFEAAGARITGAPTTIAEEAAFDVVTSIWDVCAGDAAGAGRPARFIMMPGIKFRNAAPATPTRAGIGEFLATPIAPPIISMVTASPVPREPEAQLITVWANSTNAGSGAALFA